MPGPAPPLNCVLVVAGARLSTMVSDGIAVGDGTGVGLMVMVGAELSVGATVGPGSDVGQTCLFELQIAVGVGVAPIGEGDGGLVAGGPGGVGVIVRVGGELTGVSVAV